VGLLEGMAAACWRQSGSRKRRRQYRVAGFREIGFLPRWIGKLPGTCRSYTKSLRTTGSAVKSYLLGQENLKQTSRKPEVGIGSQGPKWRGW